MCAPKTAFGEEATLMLCRTIRSPHLFARPMGWKAKVGGRGHLPNMWQECALHPPYSRDMETHKKNVTFGGFVGVPILRSSTFLLSKGRSHARQENSDGNVPVQPCLSYCYALHPTMYAHSGTLSWQFIYIAWQWSHIAEYHKSHVSMQKGIEPPPPKPAFGRISKGIFSKSAGLAAPRVGGGGAGIR